MIELETVHETAAGTRFDRLMALLIGLVAITASALAVAQTVQSQAETRANLLASRTAVDVATKLSAIGFAQAFLIGSWQRALQLAIEGTSRQIVAIGSGDVVEGLKGEADVNASNRLQAIASLMGALPDESGPVDAYARSVLSASIDEARAESNEQGRLVGVANAASAHSGNAVLGLSMVALAGVLVGLAGVLGKGRAGTMTLFMAYLACGAALAGLVLAVV